jgi:UDP-N-acetylmuramoylalanine--D-glutamate ligase
MKRDWTGLNVVILGAARQGLALARFLVRQGARVTLSDHRPAAQLEQAMKSLEDYPVRWALGGHPLEVLDGADLLCLSGGIPLTLPIVLDAQRRGLPLSNDSQIFMEAVPCRVIAITGSAGKTTTTTLVGRMAAAAAIFPHRAWVGGNIGLPLIDRLDEISADDVVVLELSSFQLEQMTASPQIAVILNITPNHLDRHDTMAAYTAAKARILEFQTAQDTAVLGREDAGAWNLAPIVKGRLVSFSVARPPEGETGAFLDEDVFCFQDYVGGDLRVTPLAPRNMMTLRGRHNVLNALAACAVASAAGFPQQAVQQGISGFNGVPHRLELVRNLHGVCWYNDSIATAPERTIAAIQSFDEPLVLLLGGRDKKLPWEDLAALVHQRVDHVVVFGEASPLILRALGEQQPGRRPYTLAHCQTLHEAISAAAEVAEPGDVVLLSPSCTSFDEFTDFEERGERFKLWVNQLT